MSEDKCHNGTSGCSFEPDGDEAVELRREISDLLGEFGRRSPTCTLCIVEEVLSLAASLHIHALKAGARASGEIISADQIYKQFCDTAHGELHKIVDLEIEHGGMEAFRKQ
jgi:hypothetical protein